MLDYIDDEGMRKTVPRSLNRGESVPPAKMGYDKQWNEKILLANN